LCQPMQVDPAILQWDNRTMREDQLDLISKFNAYGLLDQGHSMGLTKRLTDAIMTALNQKQPAIQ